MEKTYKDNAMNRRLGRVGMPIGSMPQSSSGSNANLKEYVDNEQNRRLGRVGLQHGTAKVSNQRHHSEEASTSSQRNQTPRTLTSSHSATDYVSSQIRSAGNRNQTRLAKDAGSDENERTRKVYVDNPQNRRLNRVGLPHGTTAESSRQLDQRDTNSSPYRDLKTERKLFPSTSQHDTRTRRSHSPVATHDAVISQKNINDINDVKNVHSKQIPSSSRTNSQEALSKTTKVYVDNAHNRKLGRVGLPHGTAGVSKTDEKPERNDWIVEDEKKQVYCGKAVASNNECRSQSINDKKPQTNVKGYGGLLYDNYDKDTYKLDLVNDTTEACSNNLPNAIEDTRRRYVDNAYNRKLGRVGLPHGEAVVYKNEERPREGTTRVYVDNPQNQKLGRVGLPLGCKVFSSKTKEITTRVYADTPLNRALGRVGKTLGSMPRLSFVTNKVHKIMDKWDPDGVDNSYQNNKCIPEEERCIDDVAVLDDILSDRDTSKEARQQAKYHQNRERAENSWKRANKSKESPKTDMSFLHEYKGRKIEFNELKLHSVIGSGGFGQVYYAKWKETVVAVKIIRSDLVQSEKVIATFGDEVMKFCTMNHPNIVKFIGACTKKPDLSIVMEYMQFSLCDALHVRRLKFSDETLLSIIQQICKGMKYLHDGRIAHCDLKPGNILMDYVENHVCNVKITDFGLSMIRSHSTISLSHDGTDKVVQYIGTPRYAAPEILRGEILSQRDMLHADVWALGLVFFEVIFADEPYHNFDVLQLRTQVGDRGVPPEISEENMIDDKVLAIIYNSWNFEPADRPRINEIYDVFNRTVSIFMDQEN
ncbi:hypothetical protein ACF0H5_003468 [Mactra antiquata]